ncbi:MAG: hypothetical protein WBB42_11925 [Polyangiales bacterium]
MRPSLGSGLLLCVFAAVLGSSSTAQAWTRTVVKGARATVDVERDATLSILLRLDVEIHAGWLHELELVDLGDGVELDRYRPPYFRSEEGEIFRPEAEVLADGRIHLSFPRREAPRQGEYRVFMRYRIQADARAIEDTEQARVVWSVPAWETGLHDVSVQIRAPKGSSVPSELHDAPPGVDFQVAEHPERTIVEWRRIHLPRLTAWPLSLDVPLQAIDLRVSAPDAPTPAGFHPLSTPEERPIAWTLLLIAVLVLLKRRAVQVRMGPNALLVRSPWVFVVAVSGIVLAIGQWLTPSYLLCAVPLLAFALHRPARWTATPAHQDWRPALATELPKTETRASELLDGTSTTGLAVLLASGTCLIALGETTAALLLLPVFLTGTRYHMPATASQAADALRRFASELSVPVEAPEMSFSWELSSDAAPRLRTHLPRRRAGLTSLSFALASSPVGFVLRRKVMLVVETRAQSDADDLMRRRTNVEPDVRAPNGSILRLVDWDLEAVELLRVLAHKTPKPLKASRGTWLLREISEPGRKAA